MIFYYNVLSKTPDKLCWLCSHAYDQHYAGVEHEVDNEDDDGWYYCVDETDFDIEGDANCTCLAFAMGDPGQ